MFKPKFTKANITGVLNKELSRFRKAVLNRFELVGWEFVRMARLKTANQGGFNDVTGNLRSSIGFIIVDHGQVVKENSEGKAELGKKEAKKFMRELAAGYNNGIALIVVAGMGYAAAVESKGKDVITGSSLEAESILKAAINSLQRKLKK